MIHEANARIVTTEGNVGVYTNVDGYSVRRQWLRRAQGNGAALPAGVADGKRRRAKGPGYRSSRVGPGAGIKEAWAEAIYDDVPPPLIHEWTNPRYNYSLVKGSPLHRRLGFLATFLFDEKLISQPVDVNDVMDASVIAEVLKTRRSGP